MFSKVGHVHDHVHIRFHPFKGATLAIEVKSGSAKQLLPGMDSLSKEFRIHRKLLVGGGGIPIEDFLFKPVAEWVR